MLWVLVFSVFCVSLTLSKTYNCKTNSTVYLQKHEIAFFNMEFTTGELCNLNFVFGGKNKDIWRYNVIENYTTNSVYDNVYFESSRSSSYSLTNDHSVRQGYVLFEERNGGCPLESISSPFAFTDETQILHIRSNYEPFVASNCSWQFKAPKNYGFKVVIMSFDASVSVLKIENKTDVIANEKDTYWRRPYYIVGNWINITLSKNISKAENPFQMYVTIVKQKFEEADADCVTITSDNLRIWTNFRNYSQNYKNNVRCNFTLHLRPNIEVQFYHKVMYLEGGVDYIDVDIEGNDEEERFKNYGIFSVNVQNMTLIYQYVDGGYYLSKVFNINGTESDVFFEFVSDGSYQFSGFWIEFVEYECICAPKEIECSEINEYGIIEDNSGYYCNYMNCSFTILPCKTEYTLLNIEKIYPELDGSFIVYSNDDVVYKMREDFNGEQTNAEIYLNSLYKNEIKVITNENSFFKNLIFTVKPINKMPKPDLNISLTPENPSYIIEDGKYKMAVIEVPDSVSSQNFSLTVFQYNKGCSLPIFNDESLRYNLREKYCHFDNVKMNCTFPSKKLVIFASHDFISTPTAIQITNNYGNCVFDRTIFNMETYNGSVSAISGNQHQCSITLIMGAYAYYYISEIWTTANNEKVSVFIGTNELYFEFNSSTAIQFKNVGFFSKAYTIKIPANTSLLIKFTQYDPFFKVLPPPTQLSVLATPFYGTWNKIFYNETFVEYDIGRQTVTFTVVNYKTSKNFEFYFIANGSKMYVNKTTPPYSFKNQRIGLHYTFSLADQSDFDHGILFHINV